MKNKLSFLVLLTFVGISLAACGNEENSTPSVNNSTTPTSSNIYDDDVDLEEKYGTPTKFNLTNGTDTMSFDTSKRGYYYEAEAADLTSPAKVKDGATASGGQFVGNFEPGATMIFAIDVVEDTDAMLMASAGYWSSGDYYVEDFLYVTYGIDDTFLDNDINLSDVSFTGSGNYNTFREFVIGEVHLKSGINYIEFDSYGDALNYDYICLVAPWDGTPDEEENIVDLKEKYGDVKKKHLTDGTATMSFDDKTRGYYYEAEKATLSEKVQIEDNPSASGKKVITHFNPGETMLFEITSSVEADVLVMMSGAMYDRVDVAFRNAVKINYGNSQDGLEGEVNSYNQMYTGTGDWNIYKEYMIGEIHLEEGKNYINLLSLTAINYDYIALVNEYDEVRDGDFKEDVEINLDEKYGYPTKDVLLNGTSGMKFDDSVTGYYYEAEDADLSSGITFETGNMSGGKGIGHFQNGATMTFTINSDVETDALVMLAVTRWNDGDLLMSDAFKCEYGADLNNLSGQVNTFERSIKNHQSWSAYEEYKVGELHLVAGVNYIKFTGYNAVNVDYMCLVSPILVA